ncbi:MAG: GatB/YqeY domain-containing protein [Gemmatimonadetes bacterium]|nr:GatB/YqeY domain-containing protein [Gemmatimonadota bacterium]
MTPVPTLLQQVQGDALAARKSQDKLRSLVLGTLLSELKNRELELPQPLVDADVIEVVRKAVKRRRESVEAFTQGNRPELAEREAEEARMLEAYLPPAIDPEEIRAAVRAAMASGATTMGALMGRVTPQFKGSADGSQVSAIVREELARAAT